MKKAALYVRVSTEEQKKNGLSVDNQIDALKEYCKEHDLSYEIYSDAGISGHITYKKRPALLKLINDCQSGTIDVILFTRLDRWFRSVKDYYIVLNQLNNVPWRAIWEDYETETSSGVFKVNIMLSVAQSEAEKTSERIRNTFEYKLKNGEYVGGNKAPVGYMRDGKKYHINPDEETAIRAFFETYLSTLSLRAAKDAAAAEGIKIATWHGDQILKNPAYYGGLPYIAEGATYITKEQFDFIQKSKRKAGRSNSETGFKYIFTGLLKCGVCGRRLVACRQIKPLKDGGSAHYIRYVCSGHNFGSECTGSSISERILEKYLIAHISEEMEKYNIEIATKSKSSDSKAKLFSLRNRLERIKTMFELGDIDVDEYKAKREPIIREIAELEKEPSLVKKELPSNWIDIYYELDEDHKRAFWASILDHISINKMACKEPIIKF